MVGRTKTLRVSPLIYEYLRKRYYELCEKSQISLSFLKLSNLVAEAGVESLKRLTDEEIIKLIRTEKKRGVGLESGLELMVRCGGDAREKL
ncbi:MAG: hypothetical protein QW175_06875 [Candidatus Bathyarchaeia archaeon]